MTYYLGRLFFLHLFMKQVKPRAQQNSLFGNEKMDQTLPLSQEIARRQMAALFRIVAREGLHEGISNHFSYALSDDGQTFLMNPYGVHFSQMKSSDLLLIDNHSPPDLSSPHIDITALSIHGALHKAHPASRCLIHLHPHYATALLSLAAPDLPPIDQTSARFFNRLSWDIGFDGMGIGDEGHRLARQLGNHRCLMMGNHGILIAAETPALAWDLAFHLERACKNYITALSAGRPLSLLADDVAEKTAQQWEDYDRTSDFQQQHLDAMMAVLDVENPGYAS